MSPIVSPEQSEQRPDIAVLIDESIPRYGLDVSVNQEQLHKVFDLFPTADSSTTAIRMVGFYGEEYGITTDKDSGQTTITIGVKQPSKSLARALCDITADTVAKKPGPISQGIVETGEAVRDFSNKSDISFGFTVSNPSLFSLIAVGDLVRSFSPQERRARRLANEAQRLAPLTVGSDK